jgi:thioredoxin-related protein
VAVRKKTGNWPSLSLSHLTSTATLSLLLSFPEILELRAENGKLLSMKRMSSLVMIVALMAIAGCSGSRDLVRWIPLERALSLQKQSNQPILFYFFSKSCVYCKLMRLNTFSDPQVAKQINSVFIPVKMDIEEKREGEMPSGSKLASAFHIRGVPAFVAVNSDHRTLGRRAGFLTVRNFLSFISKISATDGKTPVKNGIAGE